MQFAQNTARVFEQAAQIARTVPERPHPSLQAAETGLQAVQWVKDCVRDLQYLVRCKATMASGQVLVQAISLRCVRVGAADV